MEGAARFGRGGCVGTSCCLSTVRGESAPRATSSPKLCRFSSLYVIAQGLCCLSDWYQATEPHTAPSHLMENALGKRRLSCWGKSGSVSQGGAQHRGAWMQPAGTKQLQTAWGCQCLGHEQVAAGKWRRALLCPIALRICCLAELSGDLPHSALQMQALHQAPQLALSSGCGWEKYQGANVRHADAQCSGEHIVVQSSECLFLSLWSHSSYLKGTFSLSLPHIPLIPLHLPFFQPNFAGGVCRVHVVKPCVMSLGCVCQCCTVSIPVSLDFLLPLMAEV